MAPGAWVVNDPTGVRLRDSGDIIMISLGVSPAVLYDRLMARGFLMRATASSLLCTTPAASGGLDRKMLDNVRDRVLHVTHTQQRRATLSYLLPGHSRQSAWVRGIQYCFLQGCFCGLPESSLGQGCTAELSQSAAARHQNEGYVPGILRIS
jgi:hypothetical protein